MSIVIAIGLCFSISPGSIKRARMRVMTFMMIHGDMWVFPFVCGDVVGCYFFLRDFLGARDVDAACFFCSRI